MKIESLKKLGNAEARLAQIGAESQRKKLQEFASDPEVAKILSYINQYKEELPLSHPIFKRIDQLKTEKENKALAKDIVSEKKKRADADIKEQEELNQRSQEIKGQINDMLRALEKDTDKIFDFLTKNQKDILSGEMGFNSFLKTKRFLISVKNGFRYGEMK